MSHAFKPRDNHRERNRLARVTREGWEITLHSTFITATTVACYPWGLTARYLSWDSMLRAVFNPIENILKPPLVDRMSRSHFSALFTRVTPVYQFSKAKRLQPIFEHRAATHTYRLGLLSRFWDDSKD